METAVPAYGLWWLVIVNSAIFILFAFTFFKPDTPRDGRSFGPLYATNMRDVPGFVPRMGNLSGPALT